MAAEHQPVIWARLSGQGKGPARSLDYASITAAAIAIADEGGIDAVSMRRIAERMGHSAMALYRHVGSKDDLTELMYDAVLGELQPGETPETPSTNWRTELAGIARNIRAVQHRHPWASRLVQRPTLGPNSVRMLEHALACVDGLGLDIDGMLDIVSTVLEFTQGFVQEELADTEERKRTGQSEAQVRERTAPYIEQLLSGGAHPYLERLIRDAEDFPDPDVVFERRLAMVLDGLAASLGAKR